jgi:hypothetical protein
MADGFGVGFFFKVLWLLVYLVLDVFSIPPPGPLKRGILIL